LACEVTLQLLRDHKDSLMSVLDAFVHDPLVEWKDDKRRMVGLYPAYASLDVVG
jgi:serine/threonine-protein kinase ATR